MQSTEDRLVYEPIAEVRIVRIPLSVDRETVHAALSNFGHLKHFNFGCKGGSSNYAVANFVSWSSVKQLLALKQWNPFGAAEPVLVYLSNEAQDSLCLFVKGVPNHIDKARLYAFFKNFGTVDNCDKNSFDGIDLRRNSSSGTAVIQYSDPLSVSNCLQHALRERIVIGGQPVQVQCYRDCSMKTTVAATVRGSVSGSKISTGTDSVISSCRSTSVQSSDVQVANSLGVQLPSPSTFFDQYSVASFSSSMLSNASTTSLTSAFVPVTAATAAYQVFDADLSLPATAISSCSSSCLSAAAARTFLPFEPEVSITPTPSNCTIYDCVEVLPELSGVQVRDMSQSVSKEALYEYFGNNSKSGGSKIAAFEFDADSGYCALQYAGGAKDSQAVVAQLEHVVDGVRVYTSSLPPISTRHALLRQIPVGISVERFQDYVEARAKTDVSAVYFSSDRSKAVVSYKKEIDIVKLQKTLKCRHLENSFALSVGSVRLPDAVVLSALPLNLIPEKLERQLLRFCFACSDKNVEQSVTVTSNTVSNNMKNVFIRHVIIKPQPPDYVRSQALVIFEDSLNVRTLLGTKVQLLKFLRKEYAGVPYVDHLDISVKPFFDSVNNFVCDYRELSNSFSLPLSIRLL